MQIIISPAKKQEFKSEENLSFKPPFPKQTKELIGILKGFSSQEIGKLMKLSPELSELNYERFQNFNSKNTPLERAALAFTGEVYKGLDFASFSAGEKAYAQNHLNILSGLYGILRPEDPIKPHRLEMGTKLENNQGSNLYKFWGNLINNELQERLNTDSSPILINLASNEYNKAAVLKKLDYEVITPNFKEFKNGQFKAIMTYAKKARGLMARFIIQNRIESPEGLKSFDTEGYTFNEELSEGNEWIFTR